MIEIKLVLTNRECAALDAELTDAETHIVNKMAGHLPDEADTATPAYRVLTALLGPVRQHLDYVREQERAERSARHADYLKRQARAETAQGG